MQSLEALPVLATRADRNADGAARARLLAVVRDPEAIAALQSAVAGQRLELVAEAAGERALQRLAAERFEILISEWGSGRLDGPRLLADARRCRPEVVRMLIAPAAETPDLIAAIAEAGVYRLLPRPLQLAELRRSFAEALEHRVELSDTARTRREAP